MTLVPHPPNLPPFTHVTFYLFSQMKRVLKGKHFADVEEVKQKTAEAQKDIQIDKFRNCFEQWEKISL